MSHYFLHIYMMKKKYVNTPTGLPEVIYLPANKQDMRKRN
jgi:hypothetical protein